MTVLRFPLYLLLFLVALLVCLSTVITPAYGDEIESINLLHQGRKRNFLLYVPKERSPAIKWPLLVFLHGGSRSARKDAELTGFSGISEREGFISAFPEGIDNHWNDGRTNRETTASVENVDDVGFIAEVVAYIGSRYSLDRSRVFIAGPSNGAMMALRIACEQAEHFAGVAAVIGTLPEGLKCAPARQIPVLMINGTADPLVPYEGGEVHFGRKKLGRVWGVEKTVAFWAQHNSCASRPELRLLPDIDTEDYTTVTLSSYQRCLPGGAVALYTIQNGGHTWPGPRRKTLLRWAASLVLGNKNGDIDASEVIWQFFKQHSA